MGYAHASLVMKDLTVAAVRKATARQLMGHVKVLYKTAVVVIALTLMT